MNFAFIVLLPVVFWLFIVMLIIAVDKPKHRPQQTYRNGGPQRHTAKPTFNRPEIQKGLFDIKLDKLPRRQAKQKPSMFGNTGFDDYSVLSRKKDYVSGYDKKYSKENIWSRRSISRQYSHTYDGHEPWDECLPKEKDPWDKDFYV